MAAPTVNDLDGLLASLNALKPPGASKNKIATITQLCVTNIQAELQITQSLYRAVKKAPPTHKLGPIYIIDGVLRQWIEMGKKAGQNVNAKRRDIDSGTYAAAIKRLSELTSPLMEDLLKALPQDQRKKVESILNIWEKGGTFASEQIAHFKDLYNKSLEGAPQPANGVPPMPTASASNANMQPVSAPVEPHMHGAGPQSNGAAAAMSDPRMETAKFIAPIPTRMDTPPGLPLSNSAAPAGYPGVQQSNNYHHNVNGGLHTNGAPQPLQFSQPAPVQPAHAAPQAPAQDLNSILSSLSGLAPTQTPQLINDNLHPPPPGYFPPPNRTPYTAPPNPATYNGYPPQPPPSVPQQYAPAAPPPSVPQQYAPAAPPPQQQPHDPLAQLRGLLPPGVLNDQSKLVAALKLLKDLQDNGVPMDQWGPVIAAMDMEDPQPSHNNRDKPNRGRDRSRSPPRRDTGGRGSPVYGTYEEIAARKAAEERGGNPNNSRIRNNDRRFRQRSPIRNSPNRATYAPQNNNNYNSPSQHQQHYPPAEKIILYDPSLPPNTIKVLSRTLFVGGASGSEQELTHLFSQFAAVQTCIVAREKRHAFVKMTTRQGALAAKAGMQLLQEAGDRETLSIARQTKWGVGFGPRECCDYGKGESVVPIGKLTDADLKWLRTAPFGGTGGRALEGGMVLEEPDIEIGAGVSSKAMSRRMGPDEGRGGGGSGNGGGYGGGGRYGGGGGGSGKKGKGKGHYHNDRDKGEFGGGYAYGNGFGGDGAGGAGGYGRPEPVDVAAPPAVPGFGFNFGAFLGGGGQR